MKRGIPKALAALALVAAPACVEIKGGAVEVNWVVRSDDGRAITDCRCADPRIGRVRLDLVSVSDPATKPSYSWPCRVQTGATPFEIAPGTYRIALTPLGESGEDLTRPAPERKSVGTPAPILREVLYGQPTEVEAFLLVARCARECSGMSGSGVCTSK